MPFYSVSAKYARFSLTWDCDFALIFSRCCLMILVYFRLLPIAWCFILLFYHQYYVGKIIIMISRWNYPFPLESQQYGKRTWIPRGWSLLHILRRSLISHLSSVRGLCFYFLPPNLAIVCRRLFAGSNLSLHCLWRSFSRSGRGTTALTVMTFPSKRTSGPSAVPQTDK